MRTRWSAICVVLAPPPRRMRAPTGAIDMHLVSTRRGATRDEMIVELYAQVLAEESTTASVDDYARHRLRLVRRDTVVRELTALRSFVRCDGHPVRALFTVIWETSLRIGTLRRLKVPEHYTKGIEPPTPTVSRRRADPPAPHLLIKNGGAEGSHVVKKGPDGGLLTHGVSIASLACDVLSDPDATEREAKLARWVLSTLRGGGNG